MISNINIELYAKQGYLVIENVLDESVLTLARETCNAAVAWKEKQMQGSGINDDGINLLNRRYFISCRKEKYFMEFQNINIENYSCLFHMTNLEDPSHQFLQLLHHLYLIGSQHEAEYLH